MSRSKNISVCEAKLGYVKSCHNCPDNLLGYNRAANNRDHKKRVDRMILLALDVPLSGVMLTEN